MFLPGKPPSAFLKRLQRAKCFKYRLPSASLHPIGSAFEDGRQFFDVQVVASSWNLETEESIISLSPKSIAELEHWIERAKADYERVIAPETVRDRIDPAWLDRIRWFVEDAKNHRPEDPKSQWAKAAQERRYDELGFGSFVCLREVYIDPTISRICMLFDALLDPYFEKHGFGIHRTSDGEIEYGIDQIYYHLAEHAN